MNTRPDWHPIMAAVEGPTATWRTVDPMGDEYGRIELRRVRDGADVRYRATSRGQVIGWTPALRLAAEDIDRRMRY